MTLCSALWDILLTAVGVFLGYFSAVRYERGISKRSFDASKRLALNSLVASLDKNSSYIHQMFTVEMNVGFYPSYPLDTVALSFANFDSRLFIPEKGNWLERFNSMRFELEHINRKLLFEYVNKRPICAAQIQKTYTDYLGGDTIDQKYLAQNAPSLSGVVVLLLGIKKEIDELSSDMKKLGYGNIKYA
jgi:hypothetical protein